MTDHLPFQPIPLTELRNGMEAQFGIELGEHSFRTNPLENRVSVETDSGEEIVVSVRELEGSDPLEDTYELVRAHLKANLPAGLAIVIPLQSSTGEDFLSLERGNSPKVGRAYLMLTGKNRTITEERINDPQFWDLLGCALGKLDNCLAEINPVALRRYQPLDLKHVKHQILKRTTLLRDEKERRLAERVITMYESIEPLVQDLRHSLIHGNIRPTTILEGETTSFLDFHDCLITHSINELAICLGHFAPLVKTPLELFSHIVEAYHKQFPLEPTELQILPYLIQTHILFQICEAYSQELPTDSTSVVDDLWKALNTLLSIPPPVMQNLFKRVCGIESEYLADDEIIALREGHLSQTMSLTYAQPLHLVQGYMQYMYSATGKQYLDMRNNVCHVGHCNPRVVKAAHKQISTLNTNTRYLHETIVTYAKKLLATLPPKFEVCFFVNSGTEANDLALRLAQAATGGEDVIALDYGYHGTSMSVAQINGQKFTGRKEKPWPHLHRVQRPGEYRENSDVDELVREIETVIGDLESKGNKLSAYIAESACGVAGQVYPPKGYFKRVHDLVRRHGGICIADEVQIGFGRVGKKFWAFQLDSPETLPDIVTMGKPAGNGHPLSIVATTREIAQSFDDGREYFNTFGGNPVSCAIGLEVLTLIQEENLQENALKLGEFLKSELKQLQERFSVIGNVRGEGLFLGIELVLDREAKTPARGLTTTVVEKLKEDGILIGQDGPDKNVICIKPPIIIERKDLEFFLRKFTAILAEVSI